MERVHIKMQPCPNKNTVGQDEVAERKLSMVETVVPYLVPIMVASHLGGTISPFPGMAVNVTNLKVHFEPTLSEQGCSR